MTTLLLFQYINRAKEVEPRATYYVDFKEHSVPRARWLTHVGACLVCGEGASLHSVFLNPLEEPIAYERQDDGEDREDDQFLAERTCDTL